MTRLELFEQLPLSERTLLRRMRDGRLPVQLDNSDQPCEYTFTLNGQRGMVKYYRGRKLACYELVETYQGGIYETCSS